MNRKPSDWHGMDEPEPNIKPDAEAAIAKYYRIALAQAEPPLCESEPETADNKQDDASESAQDCDHNPC